MTSITQLGEAVEANSKNNKGTDFENLAKTFGLAPSASLVYCSPVEREGLTVIPVAQLRYGYGGGANAPQSNVDSGIGGGAGFSLKPMGFIVMSKGKATYKPIVDPVAIVRTVLGFNLLAVLLPVLLKRNAEKKQSPKASFTNITAVNTPLGNFNLPLIQTKNTSPLEAGIGFKGDRNRRLPFLKVEPTSFSKFRKNAMVRAKTGQTKFQKPSLSLPSFFKK